MSSSHGKFVWYELMTTDTAAARAFYSSVIGWSARDAGMPNMPYTLFSAAKGEAAGLMELPENARAMGARPAWIGYVAVDDVDRSAAELKQAGGSIYREPDDIPGVGRFAIAADPHRATIALFKGGRDEPPDTPDAAVGWHELQAGDREADFAFYAKLFGWTKAEGHDMGPMGIYQIVAHDGVPFGAIMTKAQAAVTPFWLYYFTVGKIDIAAGKITAGGGQVLNGPIEVPGGAWIVQGRDPQGAIFALVGPRG